jgi:hypothetical protein
VDYPQINGIAYGVKAINYSDSVAREKVRGTSQRLSHRRACGRAHQEGRQRARAGQRPLTVKLDLDIMRLKRDGLEGLDRPRYCNQLLQPIESQRGG